MFVSPVSFLHRSRRLVAALLLLAPLVAGAQPAVEVAGTLPEDYLPPLGGIIETALRQGPSMLLQNVNLAQADANLIAGEVNFWPTLGGSGSYSTNVASTSGGGSTSTATGAYYNIGFSQQLFAWGANKATADVARLGVQIAKRQWAEAFRTLAGSLRGQYLALIYQKMALRNAAFQLQMMKADLATQEEMVKDGTLSPGAINSTRLNVQQQSLTADQTAQYFAHARRMFAHLAGLDDLPEDAVPAEIPLLDTGPAVARSEGLLNGFIHGGAEDTLPGQVYVLQLKQSDLNYWIQRTRLYPKFSMTAGYSVTNSQVAVGNTVTQSAYTSYNYGISGNWNIFDGFQTRSLKLSVLASKRTTERQFKDYVDGTNETVSDGQKQVGFLARALAIQEQNLALAKDGYDRTSAELKEGTVAKVTVDGVQALFYGSEYNANVARANFLKAWSDFVSLVGADPVLGKIPTGYVKSNHGP